MTKPVAIDLYCGCGGMSAGALRSVSDLDVRWALDSDRQATRTFKQAHPAAVVDTVDVASASVPEIIRRTDLERIDWFFAGPTCKAASTMGVFNAADPRNALFVHFGRLLRGFVQAGRAPATIVLENVPGVTYGRNFSIVRDLFTFLRELGYFVYADVLNLAALGLPQLRHRFFLIATRDPRPTTFPAPLRSERNGSLPDYISVADAISDLYLVAPAREAASMRYVGEPTTDFQRRARGSAEAVHNHHWSEISARH